MSLIKNCLNLAALSLLPFSAYAQDASSILGDQDNSLDCLVEPSEIVELGSSVPGVVNHLFFERNNFVNEGDVVAQLDSRVELATLELANARAETCLLYTSPSPRDS